MEIIELFELLALNPNFDFNFTDVLLTDEKIKDAFNKNDSELLRAHLSGGKQQADRTTIFQV